MLLATLSSPENVCRQCLNRFMRWWHSLPYQSSSPQIPWSHFNIRSFLVSFKDILAFEKFALRVCLKNWRADYHLLLNQAHLPRLSRRRFLKVCWLFCIFTGKVAYHNSPLVRQSSAYPYQLQNSLQLSPLHVSTDHFKYSLFHHLLRAETHYTLMFPTRTLCCALNMPSNTSCICS